MRGPCYDAFPMDALELENLHIRRAHWRDFDVVASLVAECAAGALAADRRTKRRFRHIVRDLGNDLYLAFAGGCLVGLVHIVYVRELVSPRRAELTAVLVAPRMTGRKLTEVLVDFARKRARKRDCEVLVVRLGAAQAELATLLTHKGFCAAGSWYQLGVSAGDSEQEG